MARPTMVSLARELGVSRQTVSNVLNAPHLVKAETRERIRAHLEAAGYRPSAAARALRTHRSNTVAMRLGLVTDGINGAVMDRFVHAATEALQEHGYHPVLLTAAGEAEELAALGDLAESGVVDGAILAYVDEGDTRPAALTAMGIPFVAFGRPWGDPDAGHAWVDVDNAVGVRDATAHLRGLGHERIGFVGWGGGSAIGAERRRGWREAMADVDLDRLEVRTSDGIREGVTAMAQLRDRGATAAVCASDSLALGAAQLLRTRPAPGFDPGSAVFGFDDSPVARAMALSSVAQPMEEAAAHLVRLLMARLGQATTDAWQVLLPSTARPRTMHTFGLPG